MKKTVIKMASIVLAVVLFVSSFPLFEACAEDSDFVIKLETQEIDGKNGMTLCINFVKNPGIGALTFTVLYDKNVVKTSNLRYRYFYSTVLAGYLIVDHPESGYVSVVWGESNGVNNTQTGTLFQLDFARLNETDEIPEFRLGNINPKLRGEDLSGCFADFNKKQHIPTVITNETKTYGEKEQDPIENPEQKTDEKTNEKTDNGNGESTTDNGGITQQNTDKDTKSNTQTKNNKNDSDTKKAEKAEEIFNSATDVIEKIEEKDEEALDLLDGYPTKVKTIGDVVVRIFYYLFGFNGNDGIIDIIKKAFDLVFE